MNKICTMHWPIQNSPLIFFEKKLILCLVNWVTVMSKNLVQFSKVYFKLFITSKYWQLLGIHGRENFTAFRVYWTPKHERSLVFRRIIRYFPGQICCSRAKSSRNSITGSTQSHFPPVKTTLFQNCFSYFWHRTNHFFCKSCQNLFGYNSI